MESRLCSESSKYLCWECSTYHSSEESHGNLTSSELKAVHKISAALCVPVKLLERSVHVLGVEFVEQELLRRTLDIERSGGMLTADHTPRPSPGAVYVRLLNLPGFIEPEQYNDIFNLRVEQKKNKPRVEKNHERFTCKLMYEDDYSDRPRPGDDDYFSHNNKGNP